MRSSHIFLPTAAFAAILLLASGNRALADELLGLYIGGAAGQARVDAKAAGFGSFRENHSAFKVMVGVRPISFVGAEVAYEDFGDPNRQNGFVSTNVKMKAESAFGVLYLPVPVIDVFAKAGLAHFDTSINTRNVCPNTQTCPLIIFGEQPKHTNTSFAAGAGVQFKISSFAVRAEYEHFNAAGGNPSLVSLGATWTFF
jgi:opacity protein-like surface antigen